MNWEKLKRIEGSKSAKFVSVKQSFLGLKFSESFTIP
ncbi:uncharacterized protein METZ01_LOCUS448125, partial [marine metagenome]